MSANIISCSKKFEFSAVFETQLGLPRRANLQTVRSMRTVLRTRTHVARTLCAAAAACSSRSTMLNVDQNVLAGSTMLVRYAGHWCGYLSGARCKWFAYGPADATATPSSLAPVKSRMVYLSGAGLPMLSWEKAVKRM